MSRPLNTLAMGAVAMALLVGPAEARPARPLFAERWIDGTNAAEPQTQAQRIDADTYVIRQSLRTNVEAPFLYLLFGKDRALLIDTGAGGLKIRPAVDAVIARWLAENRRASIPLVVAHTHGHGDHRQGDAEFADRPETTVVGIAPEAVAAHFGIRRWPVDVVTYDLGGRPLSIIPSPGHHPSHIFVLDRRHRLLISGDSLYPGRLYVRDFPAYRASVDRVVAATRGKGVRWVLGAHIEMTDQPGKDFGRDVAVHPGEHRLELSYADLLELQTALHRMGDSPVRQTHEDFIITPVTPR